MFRNRNCCFVLLVRRWRGFELGFLNFGRLFRLKIFMNRNVKGLRDWDCGFEINEVGGCVDYCCFMSVMKLFWKDYFFFIVLWYGLIIGVFLNREWYLIIIFLCCFLCIMMLKKLSFFFWLKYIFVGCMIILFFCLVKSLFKMFLMCLFFVIIVNVMFIILLEIFIFWELWDFVWLSICFVCVFSILLMMIDCVELCWSLLI